jgi:hypothetical protein
MAVPIKSNNTQQGCNPISSNCVVWQGPNIPCINLCTGDSVSDVIAKMATELCDITSQTDISLLDLSCFNPLYPTPQNFRDVMQIILNKICALENPNAADGGINTSGCPSDCEITVAPCLQYSDNLGNTVTSLPLKDYVILIGNRICTILTSIANLQTQIDALDTRVTNLENGSSSGGGGSASFNVTSNCLSQGSVSLQEYISLLDTAFCQLQTNAGTISQYTSASSTAACVVSTSPQIANPNSSMGLYSTWINSPLSSFELIQNLWTAVCDLRIGITALQDQLDACCAPEAICPVFPQVLIDTDKNTASGNLFFTVNATTNAAGNVVIAGEEWKLVRFEGIVIPTATGLPISISPSIPNVTLGSSVVDYTGAPNTFFTSPAIANSLGVTTSGLFYWENVSSGQQCSVAPTNNGVRLTTLLAPCPSIPGSASPNIVISPDVSGIVCTATGGANFNISLSNFLPVTGPGVTGSYVAMQITYTPFGTSVPITINQNLTSTSTSVSVASIKCSSSVTINFVSTNQNGVSVPCGTSYSITIPAPL